MLCYFSPFRFLHLHTFPFSSIFCFSHHLYNFPSIPHSMFTFFILPIPLLRFVFSFALHCVTLLCRLLTPDGATLHPENVPSKIMGVVMRIDASVTLQSSFETTLDHVPEWSRGNQVLTSGGKYEVNAESTPTILLIRNAGE